MKLLVGIATEHKVEIDPEQAVKLAGELVQSGLELVTNAAKKKAAAAGDAAGAAVTTEDEAEAVLREP